MQINENVILVWKAFSMYDIGDVTQKYCMKLSMLFLHNTLNKDLKIYVVNLKKRGGGFKLLEEKTGWWVCRISTIYGHHKVCPPLNRFGQNVDDFLVHIPSTST